MNTPYRRLLVGFLAVVLLGTGAYYFARPGKPAPPVQGQPAAKPRESTTARETAPLVFANRRPGQERALSDGARATPSFHNLPLPPVNAPVASYYRELRARALSGDAKAACRIAHDRTQCSSSREYHREMVAKFERQLASPEELGNTPYLARLPVMHATFRKDLKAIEERCAGFAPDPNEPETWQYVLSSAQGGNAASMARFLFGYEMQPKYNEPATNPEAWVAYKQNASEFLQSALRQGDSLAFLIAARAYQGPSQTFGARVVEPDPILSITYFAAAMSRTATGSTRLMEDGIRAVAERNKIPGGEVERAVLAGRAIAASFPSKVGKDPIDNTYGIAPWAFKAERCEE